MAEFPHPLARAIFGASGLLFASIAPLAASAQPPPPPPPGMPDYVGLLENAYNSRDLNAYASLFREDLQIFLDGQPAGSNREAWLARIRQEFRAEMKVRPLSWAQGSQILVMEAVTGCVPSVPALHTVHHGCYATRAIRYDLDDGHRIAAVHVLNARAWNLHE